MHCHSKAARRPRFNYEARNVSVYQISTQSGNAEPSYWWFNKFVQKGYFDNRWAFVTVWAKYALGKKYACVALIFSSILTWPLDSTTCTSRFPVRGQ